MIATGDLIGNRIAYKITISSQNVSGPSKISMQVEEKYTKHLKKENELLMNLN